MLVIRNANMKALEEVARRRFEDQMVSHLRDFSPPLFKAAGEAQAREMVLLGMSTAEKYEFTNRGPMRLYLELMLLFGSHFDTDPQYPWAAPILSDNKAGSQLLRAEALHEKALEYRKHVTGPDGAYALGALKKIRTLLAEASPPNPVSLVPYMRDAIFRVYPQKVEFLGAVLLDEVIHAGVAAAKEYRLLMPRGGIVLVLLMFGLGRGCADDPLYPWVGRTLRGNALVDPKAGVEHLEIQALTWLDRLLAYLGKGEQG